MSERYLQVFADLAELSSVGLGVLLSKVLTKNLQLNLLGLTLLTVFLLVTILVPIGKIAYEYRELKPGLTELLFNLSTVSLSAILGITAFKSFTQISGLMVVVFIVSLQSVVVTSYLRAERRVMP